MYHKFNELIGKLVTFTTKTGNVYVGEIIEFDNQSNNRSEHSIVIGGKSVASFTRHDEATSREYIIPINNIDNIGIK